MTIEVILTGSFGVGKSSIFNRFIHDEFSSKYYGTMGVRVNEKEIEVKDMLVKVKLWDIAGEIHQKKVPKPYFVNKTIILYIIDITRPFTFINVRDDIQYLKENAKKSIVKIIGNKKDLMSEQQLVDLQKEQSQISFDWFTSAKTGENIGELFSRLIEEVNLEEKIT